MSNNTLNISSAVVTYLKRIAQTPLLKPEEEKAFFEELQIQKNLLGKILAQLQAADLLDSERQEQLKQVFRFRHHRAEDGRMEISAENLGRLHDLIVAWHRDAIIQDYRRNQEQGNSPLSQKEFDVILTELQLVIQHIQALQQRLVEANLLLVASIAKQFALIESPLSFLDLMQEGSIGLMKAIYKFRLEKGGRFSTYATWWISQSIRRALDEQSQLIRLPAYIIEERRRAEKVSLDLMKHLGREPRMSELAEAVNITESKLDTILQAPKDLLSLDSPLEESDDRTKIADLIKDNMAISPEDAVLFQARREVIEKILATLPPKQASVIRLRYGLFDGKAHTLAQIGRKLKITRERVRQIEVEALDKLRHPIRRCYWEELFE
jgi:RNA polymerase sigma factor (sigma-70 family)